MSKDQNAAGIHSDLDHRRLNFSRLANESGVGASLCHRSPNGRVATLASGASGILAVWVCLAVSAWPAIAETNRIEVTSDLQITPLAEGVWLHTSWQVLPGGMRYPSNGLLVREGDALMLIDTAWGEQATRDLLAWVARELKLPVTRAIVTHAHDDRMGGAPLLAERRIPVLSHPLTGALAAKQGWPRPAPLATLSEAGSSTNVGTVEVFYPGPAHTVDNLMVWIPRAQILFGGCAVKELKSRNLGNAADADVAAWPATIRRAQKRCASQSRLVVPAHGEVGGPDLLSHTLTLCAEQKPAASGTKPEQ